MSCSVSFRATTAASYLAFSESNWPNIASLAANDVSCTLGEKELRLLNH